VTRACENRDQAVQRITKPAQYRCNQDVAKEVDLIASWMKAGHTLTEIRAKTMDPKRAALWDSLVHPPEYDVPYLR
jgi:hypothetical protein